jgi:GTP cyclohydrolase II
VAGITALGITVLEQVSTAVHRSPANAAYLTTKARRGAHRLVV